MGVGCGASELLFQHLGREKNYELEASPRQPVSARPAWIQRKNTCPSMSNSPPFISLGQCYLWDNAVVSDHIKRKSGPESVLMENFQVVEV